MKVTEFLNGRDVERQAVTRYINRHEELFKGHTKKIGKEIELDPFAVNELDKIYPLSKPVTIINGVPHEEFIQLQNELIESQKKTNELQQCMLEVQEKLAIARATELLLEDKEKRILELEALEENKEKEIGMLKEALAIERSKSWFQKLLKK